MTTVLLEEQLFQLCLQSLKSQYKDTITAIVVPVTTTFVGAIVTIVAAMTTIVPVITTILPAIYNDSCSRLQRQLAAVLVLTNVVTMNM